MQFEAETTVPPVPKSLIATIPSWSSRYDQTGSRCKPAQWVVRPGISQSQPRYLPPTWNSYIQPEGQLYFASDATPHTVTDVNFHDDVKQEKVVRFAELVCKVAEARNIVLPETSELYLEPAKTEDSAYYYFVDHATQTVFWLDEHNSESFGLDDVVSETQSAFLLEYQYWYHIQCFPSHRAHHLSLRLDELIPVFLHGECDQRTSPTSTFPYAAKQCKEFLRLLQYAKENPYSPFNVCFVARLWSILANHRHFTFYGQPLARLDRTQIVVDHPERKRGLVFAAASHLLLGVPESYGGRLEECWIDNVAIDYVWTDFLARTRGEWRESLIMSFGLSLFNALLLLIPGTSELLAIASLLCCAVATLASLALGSRPYPVIVEAAASFLAESMADCHATNALAFALPRAFFLWATGLTVAQALVWLERMISERVPLEREISLCIFVALALTVVLVACIPWRRCRAAVSRAIRRALWRRARSDSQSAPEICEKV